ncbi:MAG: heme-binding domain-containing protein [Bacteroidota bacterium]|nr:heme-binding domain-containing protein [Bacteroidota bacterium]
MKKKLKWIVIAVIAGVFVIQFFRPDRTNPQVNPAESIEADSTVPASVKTILRTSCYDCHSNETVWPWYSSIAPMSWLVADDVHTGRHMMNFSLWGTYPLSRKVAKVSGIYDQISKGSMPLGKYLLLHPDARLTPAQRDTLLNWTQEENDRLTGNDDN